jgi:hypothetical protein
MTDKQFWQERLFSDVLSSKGDYSKAFTLPRGSGVTTFVLRLAREFSVIYAGTDAKIVVLVQNRMQRNYIQSFLTNPTASALSQLTGGVSFDNVLVLSADDANDVSAIPVNGLEWLINDGVVDGDAYFKLYSLHVNNLLEFATC